MYDVMRYHKAIVLVYTDNLRLQAMHLILNIIFGDVIILAY